MTTWREKEEPEKLWAMRIPITWVDISRNNFIIKQDNIILVSVSTLSFFYRYKVLVTNTTNEKIYTIPTKKDKYSSCMKM